MKTVIVSIIRNTTGETGDKNNYMTIALVTVTSLLLINIYLKFYNFKLSLNLIFTNIQNNLINKSHTFDDCITHFHQPLVTNHSN